jgi:hypothetical protein
MICFPTTYAGTNFRSRLEARWAAFFDLCGWRWEYEPSDERGWIPDFLLIGCTRTTKVEVKSIGWVGTTANQIIEQAASAVELAKVRRYVAETCSNDGEDFSEREDVLTLGSYIHFLDPTNRSCLSNAALGVFLSERWNGTDLACLGGGHPPRQLDFYADSGSYAYRMGSEHDGSSHILDCECATITKLWRQAGNAVQWRPDNLPVPIVRPKWSL